MGATSNQPSSHRVTKFNIARPDGKGKIVPVEALMLSKITSILPLRPVSLDTRWKHLESLKLADPGFGNPGNVHVDLLLGADIHVFSRVVYHGWRFGPSGSLSAGAVHMGHTSQGSTNQCYSSTIAENQCPWQSEGSCHPCFTKHV